MLPCPGQIHSILARTFSQLMSRSVSQSVTLLVSQSAIHWLSESISQSMNKRASDQLLTFWVNQPVKEQASKRSTSDSLRQSVSQWTSKRANHWIIEQAAKQHCHRRLTGYTCMPKRHVNAVEVSGNRQKTFREKHSYVSRQMCHVAVMDVSQEFLFENQHPASVKDVSYRCFRSIRRKWSRGAIQLQKQIRISFLFFKETRKDMYPSSARCYACEKLTR